MQSQESDSDKLDHAPRPSSDDPRSASLQNTTYLKDDSASAAKPLTETQPGKLGTLDANSIEPSKNNHSCVRGDSVASTQREMSSELKRPHEGPLDGATGALREQPKTQPETVRSSSRIRNKPVNNYTSDDDMMSVSEDQDKNTQLPKPLDNHVDSCIVKLPSGAKSGDVLTIPWPTKEPDSKIQDKTESHSKRRRINNNGDSSPTKSSSSNQLLVRFTIPNFSIKRNKPSCIRVVAPWIAAQKAANHQLTAQQLRTIGIETSTGSRRSRRVERRNRGEGNVEKRSCPIGPMHQVSIQNIPKAGTWKVGSTENNTDVECEQLWDQARGEQACNTDKRIDQYLDSLQPFQKAQFIMTLHQSNYDFDTAKERMGRKTMQIEVEAGPSHKCETTWQKCDKPNVFLEGTPLDRTECEAFHKAIEEHRKQFRLIAEAVGTTVNRCLVHYYSKFKGEDVGNYAELKKIWEQSDECQICSDGGELICCDGCINSYHRWCLNPPMQEVPEGKWFCDDCQQKKKAV